MNKLQTINQEQAPVVQSAQQAAFLGLIEKTLTLPNADFSVIEKMLDMQERILAKEAEMKFNSAFSVMVNEIPIVAKTSEANIQTKSGSSYKIKYASLDEIVEVVRPILSRHGFAVNFKHDQENAATIRIVCVLRHRDGHSIENSMVIPVAGGNNQAQAIGSTITYGKRYTLCSMLNIATGDDRDGFTVKADEANRKMKLSDERFGDALKAVRENKYSLTKLIASYDLTDDQKAKIDLLTKEEAKQDEK